jgi:murein DD-endopeptidase MepM/ murein hydrolase activator NlpD
MSYEEDGVDEEINLDELMAELEEMSYDEDDDMKEGYDEDGNVDEGDLDEGKFLDSFKKAFQAAAQGAGAALRGGSSRADTTLSDLLLKLARNANSYEDWKKQALVQGEKLIKSGEVKNSMEALNAIVNSSNWKNLFEQTSEGKKGDDDKVEETFDIDALIAEIEADLEEGKKGKKGEDKKEKEAKEKEAKTEATLNEALATVKTLKSTISEMNLLNSKLLYCNKLFRANSLNESQKVKVVDALDKATTTGEAKLVFETLQESFTFTGVEKRAIKEGLGRASKPAGVAPKKVLSESVDETVSRFQKLANINK